jgi:predicted nucleic acid-binding protein
VILDTDAVSGILAGDSKLESILLSAQRHELPVVVVGEYQFGLIGSRKRARLQSLFDRLVSESVLLDIDGETARQYATIRYQLKAKGRPIPENDIWIAALARQHDLVVVSRDPHFDAVDGIGRQSW